MRDRQGRLRRWTQGSPPRRSGGMLAIDTNLIVRYLVNDDPGQAARARGLIDNNDVFVCTTIVLESEWVLRSAYGFAAGKWDRAVTGFGGRPGGHQGDARGGARGLG